MIETKVDGTPSAVDSAADFLKSTLRSAFDTAADLMPNARREAESSWEGAASDAYRGMLSKILKATDAAVAGAAHAYRHIWEIIDASFAPALAGALPANGQGQTTWGRGRSAGTTAP